MPLIQIKSPALSNLLIRGIIQEVKGSTFPYACFMRMGCEFVLFTPQASVLFIEGQNNLGCASFALAGLLFC